MKKMFFVAAGLLGLGMTIIAADFRRTPGALNEGIPSGCRGYTIVEFDKGVDCNGDTIRLIRRHGFAERAL